LKREYLSTEQEYQRAENAFKSYGRSMKDYQKNIERFENKNKPLIKSAQKNITAFDKLIAQAEKAAKDLGVKIPTASFSKLRDRLRKFI
jgi:predicted RNase H-like nuclease (RuvC/YqgF family)